MTHLLGATTSAVSRVPDVGRLWKAVRRLVKRQGQNSDYLEAPSDLPDLILALVQFSHLRCALDLVLASNDWHSSR